MIRMTMTLFCKISPPLPFPAPQQRKHTQGRGSAPLWQRGERGDFNKYQFNFETPEESRYILPCLQHMKNGESRQVKTGKISQ